MTEREERVLLSIGRRSDNYRSAIVSAVDQPVAERLQDMGLVRRCTFDNWFNITERGVQVAQGLA